MKNHKIHDVLGPPFLSTSFSESGKRAKNRFANILNMKLRPAGVAAAVIAAAAGIFAGAAVTFARVPDQAPPALDAEVSSLRPAFDSRMISDPVGFFAENGLTVGAGTLRGVDKLDAFLASAAEKENASLYVVKYGGGGPMLMLLTCDGGSFSATEYDRNGPMLSSYFQPYGPYEHLRVFREGGDAYFYLVNDPKLTHKEIFSYQLSSAVIEDPPEFAQLFFIEEENAYETAIY